MSDIMGTPGDTTNDYMMSEASMLLNQDGGAGDCSLDYSVWHKNLLKQAGAEPVNTVKVRRIDANGEELRQEQSAEKRASMVENQVHDDYLLNYTFDLSLDDHARNYDKDGRNTSQITSEE